MITEKMKRPKTVHGFTVEAMTGCGLMTVIVSELNGRPFEVFIDHGKSGGCEKSQCEAITRCISVGLRYNIPITEYIEQLNGITCYKPVAFPRDERALSCPDAIARILADEYIGNAIIKDGANE